MTDKIITQEVSAWLKTETKTKHETFVKTKKILTMDVVRFPQNIKASQRS